MECRTQYGLMLPDGTLARVSSHSNAGGYACGDRTYTLTNRPDDPEWLVDDPDAVAQTLFRDTPWYNTDSDKPGWGNFERDHLRPVRVVTTREVTPADEIRPMPNVEAVECRDIPVGVARRYACTPELPAGRRYIFVLCRDPLAEVTGHVGSVVAFGDLYNTRRVVAAVPVPEDYADTGAGSLLICNPAD